MNSNDMVKAALEYGFTNAKVIESKELVFDPELRVYCEENTCGNYGRNHACPPDCGTQAEMKERTMKYKKALILQTVQPVDSVMDSAQTKAARKAHNLLTGDFMDYLKKQGVDGLRVMAGPCSFCEVCGRITDEPCRFPDKLASCLSAYCIDAGAMAETCGMPYWCGNEEVPFFSIYFL
ncbi:MAG: DUF2284 domain-containing protein [Eubacteriales bacterium]|nr:DUF2284 domain-containing protein [Eubacteriales bacterium]